jgi:hypothetical protein
MQVESRLMLVISDEYILRQDLSAQDVTQYKIKGYWYFDKRQSELKYRLLGICPVTPDVYTMNSEEKDYIELFWVFSQLLVKYCMKLKHSMIRIQRCQFDQILNSRRFNAVIYKEKCIQR